jgi:heme-degrading monooxygenase HmoA
MNTPEFPVGRGIDPLGEDREGGGGMFVRMFTIEGRREQLDEFARIGEKKLLPALRSLDGFGGLLVLTKRGNGKILVVTLWASREAMRAGEEASRWLRAFGAESAGGEVTSVERYEVVFSGTGRAQETSTLPGSSTPHKAERGRNDT